MRLSKRIISIILSLTMIVCLFQTPQPVQAAVTTAETTKDADALINDLILYYRDYQESAETDILRVLDELKAVDELKYEEWKQIMDYWSYINTDMVVNTDTTTVTDLPTDDSLCIVILGYALNDDGTMKDELIGRLETGLALANQYPNAYVAVTGGGTAANNTSVTEGGLMGEWMLEQGLDEGRLIIENQAPNTVGNALNTYNILRESYPSVDSICLVTSDYHVPRGCLLFYSKCLIAAYESNDQLIDVISNAGYVTGTSGYESISLQATGLASVADISLSGSVSLSELSYLTVEMNEAYTTGAELDLTVTAVYDSGYTRDVTDVVEINGFDSSLDDSQTLTVSYTENDVTVSGDFTLSEMSKEIVATGHLESLIAEAEAIDSASYTEETVAILNTALADAKALLSASSYTVADVDAAYQTLKTAYNGLIKIVNAAYLKSVTASCNQDEAYKLVNGSTSDYWTSKDSSGDVAIADSYFTIDLNGNYELDYIHVVPYYGNSRYYHYDVQISTDGENWETVVEHRSTDACTSAGNTHEMEEGTYARYVKVVGVYVYRPDKTIINFHVKEVSVYGVETENIALGKPITSSGTDTSASSSTGSSELKVIDGEHTTYWDGGKYSARPWVDIDLGDVYKLDSINVINYWNGSSRYYQYEVYTSVDGVNYTLLGEKTDEELATLLGETYECTEEVYAAHVKVVGTYNSQNSAFHLNEVRIYGEVADEESYEEYLYNAAKTALSDLVAEYEAAYGASDYTEDSWSVYAAALTAAKELLESSEATTENLQEANDLLKAAAEQLTYLVYENPEGTHRLASTNLYAKGNTDIDGVLKQFYNRYSVDYAGLQEVDRNTSRNPYDMMEALTTDTRFVDFAFNKNMDYQGGEYGIGILSTTEIKEKSGGLYEQLGSEEQRGWVRTVVEIDGKEVAFYNTHLSTTDEACISNMAEIIKLMDEDPLEYKILTADFNCNREWMYPFLVNYNMANGKDGLWYATSGDDYTDVASSEAYGLDNIITSRNIEVVDFKVIDSQDLSDHNFIYIDFKLLDEEVPSTQYLDIEVEDAQKLEESDYTEESYAVLKEALADAEALAEDASQAEINEVLFAIQDGVENLERIYPLISEGKTVTVDGEISSGEAGYINDGNIYSYLKTSYSNDIIMDLGGLYQIDEIQVFPYGKAPRYYYYTLYTSIDGVNYEYFGEKTSNEIASIKTGDVFEKENCMARYVIIEMTYNSASTSDHVYLSELEVYGALAEGTDDFKTALGQLITSYSQLNSEDYVGNAFENLQNAISEGTKVYNDADATKEEVDTAYNNLLAAFNALEPAADTTELLALIESSKALELSGYSERTVNNLQAKIAAAEAVCVDKNATQTDADEAYEALNTAISLLAAPINVAYKMEMTSADNTVMVTLDGIYHLDEIVVITNYDDSVYYNYVVSVSEDGETWNQVAEQTGDVVATEEGYVHEVDNTLAVKYIKLESTETLDVTSIYAYGEETNNIALGKPVTFGNSTTGNAPLAVNDGSRTNYWEAGKYSSSPWVVVDLEGLYKLDSVNVITYWSRNDRYYNYEVYVSTDGEEYTLYASRDNTDYVTVYGDTFEAEGDVYASHIKIVGTYNSKNTVFHLNEIRAYGELYVEGDKEPTSVTEVFSDVAEGAWYVDYVQYVYDKGIMSGSEGIFAPTGVVTRAMVAETLYKMEGRPDVTEYHEYDQLTDLSRDDWWAASVAWALNADVATGDTYHMLFNPEDSVTREQLVTFLYRYANLKGIDTAVSEDAAVNDERVSAFALEAFTWAVETDLITGMESTDADGNVFYDLAPQSGATRAELAAILQRFCETNNI